MRDTGEASDIIFPVDPVFDIESLHIDFKLHDRIRRCVERFGISHHFDRHPVVVSVVLCAQHVGHWDL